MSNRDFYWLSSIDEKNKKVLNELNLKLANFYSELNSRRKYNAMIKGDEKDQPLDEVTQAFLDWFKKEEFHNILEIGCGTGRIRKHLNVSDGSEYTGIEVSEDVINANKISWPYSNWFHKSVYDVDFPDKSFDLIYSFYVLEHLVFPHAALEKMYKLTKPGGKIVIICPDFFESKRLASQFMGLGFLRSAKEKLKKFKFMDALVGLYDSKIRLNNMMDKLKKGPALFMINVNPICLFLPQGMEIWPDFDAVYITGKTEIEKWAELRNMKIFYPGGKNGKFKEHTFIVLQK
jgi:ubiquinone/menaquinone biosynthesis C-methylase UbiE